MASPETAVAWMMHDSIIQCKDANNPFAEFKRMWYRAARYLLHKAESMTTLELLEQHGIDGHASVRPLAGDRPLVISKRLTAEEALEDAELEGAAAAQPVAASGLEERLSPTADEDDATV